MVSYPNTGKANMLEQARTGRTGHIYANLGYSGAVIDTMVQYMLGYAIQAGSGCEIHD